MTSTSGNTGDGENSQSKDLAQWRPLTRKLDIPASTYRRFVFFNIVAVGLFLAWKITQKNEDAIWLWGISLVCELWFAFSWLLNHLPKLFPINHEANLTVLQAKFESITTDNPTGKSDLPGIDVFVSAADSEKEPPSMIANTILSVLSVDYPVQKLCCYVSDDGGDILTFETMTETATFAELWIPFCRKHNIECRNPEKYFNSKENPYKRERHTDFVNDRRRVKRQYHEFEIRIIGLSESIAQRSGQCHSLEVNKATELPRETAGSDIPIARATRMYNGIHWPGTWKDPSPEHTYGHHAGMVQALDGTFLMYLLIITLILFTVFILEMNWSDITLKKWWRNRQFWLIGGTSSHLAGLIRGLLKIITGSELACQTYRQRYETRTSALFSAAFAPPYNRNLTPLLILPITIVMVNLIVIAVGIGQAIFRVMPMPQRSKLLGSVLFSFWVLAYLYHLAEGLAEQRQEFQ